MKIIKHILGAYNPNTLKQHCLICGKTIIDYNNALSENGQFASWEEGEFYEAGKNPTVMFSGSLPPNYMEFGDELINCDKI